MSSSESTVQLIMIRRIPRRLARGLKRLEEPFRAPSSFQSAIFGAKVINDGRLDKAVVKMSCIILEKSGGKETVFFPILHASLDPESGTELARLIDQERLMAAALGGPLTGLPDPAAPSLWQAVLDLGCGPGGWVLDVAFAYPDLEVAGIDLSSSMITYARARAWAQKRCNASFQVMDLTHPLDFSEATFDLVNARFLSVVLRRKAWSPLLAECRRILKPGGFFLFTETEDLKVESAAYHQLKTLMRDHLGDDQERQSIISHLPDLLHEAGYCQLQTVRSVLDVSRETDAWYPWVQNVLVLILQVLPMLRKFVAQEKLDQLYQQMIVELQKSSFQGIWKFTTYLYRR